MPRTGRWWTADNVCITAKYGRKALELANGKPTVEVSAMSDVVPALEILKSAIAAGELAAQLEAASSTLRSGFIRENQRLANTFCPDSLSAKK